MREVKFNVTFKIDDDYNIDSIDVESEKMDEKKKNKFGSGNTYSICVNSCNGKTTLKRFIEALKQIEV